MQDEVKLKTPRKRGNGLRRCAWVVLISTVLLLVGVGGALFVSVGRAVSAPDWLRERIEERISADLPGIVISFGDVNVTLQRNGLAQIGLHDVDVATQTGARVIELSDIFVGISPAALVFGRIEPREIELAGAFVTFRRDETGRVGLAFGEAMPTDGALPDFPTLITGFDKALMVPGLSGLTTISAESLTVRYEDVRAKRAWTVDGGRLRLQRADDQVSVSGDFAVLSGGANVATLEINASSIIGQSDLNFGFRFEDMPSQDIASQGASVAWLGVLRAPISGALRARMQEDGSLGLINATLQIGQGVLQPNRETRPVPFQSARTYFTYEPDTKKVEFSEISVDSAWGRVLAEGSTVLQDVVRGVPGAMLGQFVLSNLEANPNGFFDEPVSVLRTEMDFRLRLKPFHLTLGRLRLDDEALPLRLSGDLRALRDGWQLALDGHLAQATAGQLLALWPASVEPKARKWVSDNIKSGTLRDAVLALRSEPDQKPSIYLDTRVEDARVRYSPKLPEAFGGSGQLTIHENRLVVMVEKASIDPGQGGLADVSGTSFIIPNIRIKKGPAQVQLQAKSSVTAALAYLDHKPLSVMTKASLPVDLAEGQVSVSGVLDFPLRKGLKPEDVTFSFEGVAVNVASDKLVKDRSLKARRLEIAATTSQIQIAGAANFDGLPFEGGWTQPLGKPGATSRLIANVDLSMTAARTLGIELPENMFFGSAPAELVVALAKGKPPDFRLTSVLRGLGGQMGSIGWSFPQAATGEFEVSGALTQPVRVDLLRVKAGGLDTEGSVRLASDGSLERVSFDRVLLNNWLDAPVDLIGRGKGVAPAVLINGGRVDLRHAEFGEGGASQGAGRGSDSGPVQLRLDRLQITDSIALTDFQGDFTVRAGLSGTFTGAVNGGANIKGDVVPEAAGSAFRITSTDAGLVFRDAEIFQTASGGDFRLILKPTRTEGAYDGSLEVKRVRLRNAPAIGALLDAISIVGLIDQLEGPGILFSDVDATFRLSPDQLVVTQSSAVGPSMGISLDGYYHSNDKRLDMQGVLSPIYVLNGIGQIFSRKGEGLFGFNFAIKGTTETPKVSVNPFSVLTPGMFREIFRRPPPQVSQ